MKPLIGVTSIPRMTTTPIGETPHQTVPDVYLDLIKKAGGSTVILPVHQEPDDRLLQNLDGLLLTGGGDVDPEQYGTERDGALDIDEVRDRFELWAARTSAEQNRPVLAICRGIQLLNVALGGSLIVDVPSAVGDDISHRDIPNFSKPIHSVKIAGDSMLGSIVGEKLDVNSLHHQAVAVPAECLRAVAWAPDGVIEAVESESHKFIVGLQWHPEMLGPSHPSFAIVKRFVESSAEPRS
jgi:putative glutamine amidotransferase